MQTSHRATKLAQEYLNATRNFKQRLAQATARKMDEAGNLLVSGQSSEGRQRSAVQHANKDLKGSLDAQILERATLERMEAEQRVTSFESALRAAAAERNNAVAAAIAERSARGPATVRGNPAALLASLAASNKQPGGGTTSGGLPKDTVGGCGTAVLPGPGDLTGLPIGGEDTDTVESRKRLAMAQRAAAREGGVKWNDSALLCKATGLKGKWIDKLEEEEAAEAAAEAVRAAAEAAAAAAGDENAGSFTDATAADEDGDDGLLPVAGITSDSRAAALAAAAVDARLRDEARSAAAAHTALALHASHGSASASRSTAGSVTGAPAAYTAPRNEAELLHTIGASFGRGDRAAATSASAAVAPPPVPQPHPHSRSTGTTTLQSPSAATGSSRGVLQPRPLVFATAADAQKKQAAIQQRLYSTVLSAGRSTLLSP